MLPTDFRPKGSCSTLPIYTVDELFFRARGPVSNEVRELCNNCPVKMDCLQYAITYDEKGVWGGFSYKERQDLIKSGVIIPGEKREYRAS